MKEEISLEETKKILTDMLSYIDKICRENDIEYFLVGGTLLGAVRHKGFIPWDDDIDIGLKREEYEKLIKILNSKCDKQYQILNHDNEKTFVGPFSKLINTNTIMKEKYSKEVKNMGIYIDIFAYDNLPNNKIIRKIVCIRKKYLKILVRIFGSSKIEAENKLKKIVELLLKIIAEKMGIDKILKKYDSLNKYNNIETKYWMCNWPSYKIKKEIQRVECSKELIDCEFENLNAKIPKGYDEILTQLYGDYMKLPPEKDRQPHHDAERYWKE